MAEFAASIFALAGVAATTLEFAVKLKQLSEDIKYAQTDIRSFSVDIELFSNEIKFARKVLNRQHRNPHSSSVFEYLVKRRIISGLHQKSEFVEENIELVVPKIESLKGSPNVVAGFRWVFFNKANIQEIRSRMDSVRATLTHIMLSVKLDAARRGPQTKESQEEMSATKFLLTILRSNETM